MRLPFSHALVAGKFPGILCGLFLWGSTQATLTTRVMEKNGPTSRGSVLFSINIVLFTERHETWSSVADNVFFSSANNRIYHIIESNMTEMLNICNPDWHGINCATS